MKKTKTTEAPSPFDSGVSETLYVGGQVHSLIADQLTPGPVGYLDDIGPGDTPLIPDIKFQNEFASRVSRAIAEFNKIAKIPVVPDTIRMSGFKGTGIVDANVSYFVVRQDHSEKENYSHDHALQFRAIDYVTYFVAGGGGGGIYNRVMLELRELDEKAG